MKRYYRKNCSSVALFLVSNLLAAGSSVFMSFLLGTFADSAMEGDLSRVWKIALVTLFYLCIETFFAFLLDYSRDIVVQRVGRDLRADAVRKIEALSYMEKSEKDDGSCLSLVQNDVDTIQQDYVAALGEIYFQICCFLLAVASAIAIQPVMTLIMIAVSVLTAAFPKLTEKRLQAHQENEQQAKARYLTAITQILSGFFQLKIFNAFSGINHAHDEANETLYRKKAPLPPHPQNFIRGSLRLRQSRRARHVGARSVLRHARRHHAPGAHYLCRPHEFRCRAGADHQRTLFLDHRRLGGLQARPRISGRADGRGGQLGK